MSAATDAAALAPAGHDPHHGHDHGHEHHKFQAHHFDSMQHQFDAGKLGIWLFLITEVLFFSGLFCAYAIYRYNHPEIFKVGHLFLNKELGAVNTVVLLFSSLTMAWGVRCAQLGQRRGLMVCLILTLICAGAFMVVKYFEYSAKISHGTLWAAKFDAAAAGHYLEEHGLGDHAAGDHAAPAHPVPKELEGHAEHGAEHHVVVAQNVGIFFSIYFCLTGLHGIHILGGMAALSWLLWRANRGDFGPSYFGPVDYVGLYWHLVDLIWIYLFPLLYLIQ